MTTIDLSYPALLELFPEYHGSKMGESARFLVWYLQNYYRLDSLEAVDSVCDQPGDRGIDGIYVDDDSQTIIVFQSRISQRESTVGDRNLREFAGTLSQLSSPENVRLLIESAGDAGVASLLQRLDIGQKINDHELQGVYVTNINADVNGLAFLRQSPNISFVGKDALIATYISERRDTPISEPVDFDIGAFEITEYTVDAETKAIIAPIRGHDLLQLNGIEDQSLFVHNVRGSLGRTNVNKDITKTIKDVHLHKRFPLFHNGITVIAGHLKREDTKLTVSDYYVVNGCQSLTALHGNSDALTSDLHVLTKFIEVDPTSLLAQQITEYSNNQNGVRPRDFKANSAPQIRLQNEFKAKYAPDYAYAIKRGEVHDAGIVISNEDAGAYLMSFDLKEPWSTPRKYSIFDDRHTALFARPAVTADKILMLHLIKCRVDQLVETRFDNILFGKYVLTRYMLMYALREILETDDFGSELLGSPQMCTADANKRSVFEDCIDIVLIDLAIDLNASVNELGDDFDYRGRLRDEEWVKNMVGYLVAEREKQVVRGRIPSFANDWQERINESGADSPLP